MKNWVALSCLIIQESNFLTLHAKMFEISSTLIECLKDPTNVAYFRYYKMWFILHENGRNALIIINRVGFVVGACGGEVGGRGF